MEFRSRPNSWVSQDTASTTQLTYALQVNPAPITVSIPKEDPVLASLEFVITNPTSAPLSVQSVAFTMLVGAGASLTPTTDGITTAVSDTTNWNVVGPSSIITSGTATYMLEPVTGQSVSLAAGASVVVQIFQIQTNTTPGNSVISLKEIVGSTPGFTNFQVTTFPTGFYFNGLAVTVQSGSEYVPVAQVSTGTSVTLLWNSSVVDVSAFTIYYSNASQGQQTATPTDTGKWTLPTGQGLTSDTVFTVVVKVSVEGGQPLTASISTSVSVQNPSLVAASVRAGEAHVTGVASIEGALTAGAVTATGLTVNGAASVVNLTASGTVTVPGQSTLGTANVSALTVTGQTNLGLVTAKSVSADTLKSNGTASVSGALTAGNVQIPFAQLYGCTLSDAFTYDGKRMGWYSLGWFNDSWFKYGQTSWFSGYGGIKFFVGNAASPTFTIDYNGNCRYYGSMAKASSMSLKDNIHALTADEASDILTHLNPVKYTRKAARDQRTHLGFIAEHVHSSVATSDGKAIIPDEIMAVLTRVVKEQQQMILKLEKKVNALEAKNRRADLTAEE